VSGGDAERLEIAGRCAAEAGLEVWFAPFPSDLTPSRMLSFFEDCAGRAEDLRRGGAEVVFVTGCELSLFARGFLPGEDIFGRLEGVMSGAPATVAAFGSVTGKVNDFLARAAGVVRDRFGGRVTYAAGTWEDVDWTPFDVVSVDAYRDEENAAGFRADLRRRFAFGKPVAVTEFGCCTYRGAGGRGGTGWLIVNRGASPPRVDGSYVRSESEQVVYLRELLSIFEEEGVDSALWFTFAGYGPPHRPDPAYDLDLASYGVIKLREDGVGWEPKEVFHALAAAYG
jgi:hypothetical protein